MLRNSFNYKKINAHKSTVSEDGKIVSVSNTTSHFIGVYFKPEPLVLNENIDLSIPFNWVVYISIDDEDDNNANLENAWNNLIDIFNKYNIPFVTVLKQGQPLHKLDVSLRGRQIGLFHNINDSSTLLALLKEITQILVAANISPSYRAQNVKELQGNCFLTYNPVFYKKPEDGYMENIQQQSRYMSSSYDLPSETNENAAFNLFVAQKMLVETMRLSHPLLIFLELNRDAKGLHYIFNGDIVAAMTLLEQCDVNNTLIKKLTSSVDETEIKVPKLTV